ncbi:hypothetical protein OP10G_2829 [Fimbriimonas ginsengisoli Gsoil 348]|uniref:Uncharacterized protein n=1 Tax=Fimbriimonas ginsengisoli Gsoil 348 TaxID=661478 RepID=A0A068NS76_FIMGI|nr:hypothetical protein OP10G_2829 [Fimbriimonas ginsengisoli Gsoil 348]
MGTLAGYFGERPLQIRMYDADEERLDLFDRLARMCFIATYVPHELLSTTDPGEALHETDGIVVAVGANCARRYLRATRQAGIADVGDLGMVEQAVTDILGPVPPAIPVLSLLDPEVQLPRATYQRLDWPGPLEANDRQTLPFQILRWLKKEEPVTDLISVYDQSPLKAWLDDPRSAEVILGTPA